MRTIGTALVTIMMYFEVYIDNTCKHETILVLVLLGGTAQDETRNHRLETGPTSRGQILEIITVILAVHF